MVRIKYWQSCRYRFARSWSGNGWMGHDLLDTVHACTVEWLCMYRNDTRRWDGWSDPDSLRRGRTYHILTVLKWSEWFLWQGRWDFQGSFKDAVDGWTVQDCIVTLVGGMAAYSTVRRRYNTVVPVPTRSWISRGVKISCQSMRRKRIFPLPLHWTTPSCPPPKHQNISQSNGLTSITSITTKQTNLSNPEKQIQKRNRTNLTRAAEPSSNRIFFLMHPHASSCMRSGNLTSIVHRVVELLVERSEKREGKKKKSFIRLACIQGLFLEIWTIAREFCTIESYSTVLVFTHKRIHPHAISRFSVSTAGMILPSPKHARAKLHVWGGVWWVSWWLFWLVWFYVILYDFIWFYVILCNFIWFCMIFYMIFYIILYNLM